MSFFLQEATGEDCQVKWTRERWGVKKHVARDIF